MKPLVVPPSKSITHRAFLLSALCNTTTSVLNPLRSEDCDATLQALVDLGARVTSSDGRVTISGPLSEVDASRRLNLQNAGTGLRLLMAQAARFASTTHFCGDASLMKRSSRELLLALECLGAEIVSASHKLPISVRGPIRNDVSAHLPSGVSSQYASALLFAFLVMPGRQRLVLEKPTHSRPYFDLSLQIAECFGAELEIVEHERETVINVCSETVRSPREFVVQPDWSSAAFLFVYAMIANTPVSIAGLGGPTLQADRAIVDILEGFGATFETTTQMLLMKPAKDVFLNEIDVKDCPDLFPILCAFAATVPQPVKIYGAPNLRNKESDRIELMRRGLVALGIECVEHPDGLTVMTSGPSGGKVETEMDHRIHMSFRVLAEATGCPIETDGAGAEHISFPSFESVLGAARVLS